MDWTAPLLGIDGRVCARILCNNPSANSDKRTRWLPQLPETECPALGGLLPELPETSVSYYQKRPWTTWGTPPSNSRLIFVNCFIHAGFSLIATTLSPRCVYPAQMDTWCTVGWTDNRCALYIIKITTTCHNTTQQHNNITPQHNITSGGSPQQAVSCN